MKSYVIGSLICLCGGGQARAAVATPHQTLLTASPRDTTRDAMRETTRDTTRETTRDTTRPHRQDEALTNTSESGHALLEGVDMGDVRWTTGFWADRFRICKDSMIPHLWRIYHDKHLSHGFENFLIAAGIDTGSHEGPPFHDGDFYKLLEGMAAVYALTKDPRLDSLMDRAIAVIAACQKPDGYLSTPAIIEERNHPGSQTAFRDRLDFETYNMGHLMTAACVHYRATGKKTLLNVAIRAADYLAAFYRRSTPQLARNAICPSHYMGIVELYRTTHNPVYLRLAKDLIAIRGMVDDGTDDNQDRVPFRDQTTAMGHAVRANYLYAGVADVVAETGDDSLYRNLKSIWQDITQRKMYITGGCGALYDGVSPDATSYHPSRIQEVHQAYGRDYQLPNTTAHNETCANIGNMLFNWRMLLVSGDARYADVFEQALYNSVLSGVSLDGNGYFYTNPLRVSRDFPYTLRWSGDRQAYIALSDCCPPNLARTIAEVADYAYCANEKGLWVNLYGGNTLDTRLSAGEIRLEQTTGYPWDGNVKLTLRQAPAGAFSIFLRVPGWCDSAGSAVAVNGKRIAMRLRPGTYAEVHRSWKPGDVLTLQLPMRTQLIESNPLVEETRGQVAVRRGPVVYCLESPDLPAGEPVSDVALPWTADLHPVPVTIAKSRMMALEGKAWLLPRGNGKLYERLPSAPFRPIAVRLIPYYAWANRGRSDMTVWMDLAPAR
ncbi:MAG TPA: glycoside hydrolase family 127 protein [Puia sp.]|nr:glycoside hydrolase family 127 protein [Puia sp.]